MQAAMIKTGQLVVTHVMNPKSMPRERLLGEMDPDTREWTDGVLTAAARQVVKEPMTTRSWVVCDGDVDPEWIESLNSVLDDNHLLTLPNGERISFGSNVNFLFETHDLRFASPATISRMGMIYLSDEDVDVKRVVKRWIKQQPEADRLTLSSWMEDLFYRALDHVLQAGDFVVRGVVVVGVVVGDPTDDRVWLYVCGCMYVAVCVCVCVCDCVLRLCLCVTVPVPVCVCCCVYPALLLGCAGGHHDGRHSDERPQPCGGLQVPRRVRVRPHPWPGWKPGHGTAHRLRPRGLRVGG